MAKTTSTTNQKAADFGALRPDYGNHFYRVTRTFTVWALTGKYQGTNCYYGSSQILLAETEALRLQPGDEIHGLVGGDFAVTKDGKVLEVKMTKPSSDGVFCKNYGDGQDRSWPLSRLREIQNPKKVSYRR